MASMLDLDSRTQQSYKSIVNKERAIHTTPRHHDVDIDFPVIAKGNRIDGIEAVV